MRPLDLSRHGRANVWLEAPPPIAFEGASVLKHVLRPRVRIAAVRRRVGVELSLARDASSYAAVGPELIDADVRAAALVMQLLVMQGERADGRLQHLFESELADR